MRGEGGFHKPRFAFLAQPLGVAFDVDRRGVMQEAIEHGAGDHRVAEALAPGPETLIAREQDRTEVGLDSRVMD